MNKKECIIFFLFIIGIIVLLRNTTLSKMWAFGDLVAFPTNPKLTYEWVAYSWRGEGLGVPNFPVFNYFLIMLVCSILAGAVAAQKILLISTFILSFATSYYLLKSFHFKTRSSFLGALLYSINPVTISTFIGGGIGELMTFAVFPLFILFLFKLVSERDFKIKYITILVLLSLFLWNLYVAFWYGLIVLPGILLIGSINNARRLLRLVPALLILLIALLLNIFPLLNMYSGASKLSFEDTAKYTYGDMSILNAIRLSGNKGSAQAKEFLNYNSLNNYTVLGYILSLVIISSLLFINKVKDGNNIKKLLIFSTSFSFLVTIGALLLIRNNPQIVDINPIFSSLRNPTKLMYPLVLSFVFLFSSGTEVVLNNFSKKSIFRKVIMATLTLLILLYNYPALDGTLGLEKVRGEQYIVSDKYYQLSNIFATKNISYRENRILFLPWEYPTNLRIRSELPNYFGVPLGARIKNINISAIKTVFSSIVQDSVNKAEVLSFFNVRYVIIDKTFRSYYEKLSWYRTLKINYKAVILYYHNSYWLIGDPSYFNTLFNKDFNFRLIYEDKNFAIYENTLGTSKFFRIFSDEKHFLRTHYVKLSDNLLKNPSFENGTNGWRIYPGCLVNLSKDSTDGEYSIEFYGQKKWFTIVYQIVPVEENALYKLEFDIKAFNITDLHAKVIWYNQTEKLGEGDGFQTYYIKLYEKKLPEGTWCHISQTLLSPIDAKLARIEFLGSRLGNYNSTLILIDNVSFYKVASKVIVPKIYSKIYSYKEVNPTLYKIKINATKPFMLSFAEAYDPLWEARIYKDGKLVEKVRSIPLYSVINGFWINETGELEIVIRYTPQDWFEIGLIISAITFVSCIGYLFYDWRREKGDKWAKEIERRLNEIKRRWKNNV